MDDELFLITYLWGIKSQYKCKCIVSIIDMQDHYIECKIVEWIEKPYIYKHYDIFNIHRFFKSDIMSFKRIDSNDELLAILL